MTHAPPVRLVLATLALSALGAGCSALGAEPAEPDVPGSEAEEDQAEPHEVRVARMELDVARLEAEGSVARHELELELARRKLAEAERDLQQFALERVRELDEARLELDRAEGSSTDAQLELAELEAMYAEEEFAEKTKELVLTRGRRQQEHARRELELARREAEALESHELPQRGRQLESDLFEARGELESAERALRSARLEAELALLEAEHALEEALEEHEEHEEDEGSANGPRLLAACALLALLAPPARPGEEAAPATLSRQEARAQRDRALDWLLVEQRPDGSWAPGVMDSVQEVFYSVESFYAWKMAAHALACMALRAAPPSPERDAAFERGLAYLYEARAPRRGSDWDTDYGWSSLYAFVAAVDALDDPRLTAGEWPARLEETARRYLAILARLQSPGGGWAYYDDPIYSRRPTWDTSFCTAIVLPALRRAQELGWLEDAGVLERARRYVSRCALPEGAFAYDLAGATRMRGGETINRIKGSLGRTQVCNWGLRRAGVERITVERVREGLAAFFEHHRFLELARLRPYPHEAYYANSGYFYLFGHYYAALAIEELPPGEREGWHARLRPHVVRAQRADGSANDYNGAGYGIAAGTAYVALALTTGLGEAGERTP